LRIALVHLCTERAAPALWDPRGDTRRPENRPKSLPALAAAPRNRCESDFVDGHSTAMQNGDFEGPREDPARRGSH